MLDNAEFIKELSALQEALKVQYFVTVVDTISCCLVKDTDILAAMAADDKLNDLFEEVENRLESYYDMIED